MAAMTSSANTPYLVAIGNITKELGKHHFVIVAGQFLFTPIKIDAISFLIQLLYSCK